MRTPEQQRAIDTLYRAGSDTAGTVQARGFLGRRIANDGGTVYAVCALGAVIEEFGIGHWQEGDEMGVIEELDVTRTKYRALTHYILAGDRTAGSSDTLHTSMLLDYLTTMNDERGRSFTFIARFLEKYWSRDES